jgi:hypothetical protein
MLERTEKPVTPDRWYDSYKAHKAAKQRLDVMDVLGSHYYTAREHCDASAAAEYAEAIEEIYWQRYRDRKRIAELFQNPRQWKGSRRAIRATTP